MVNPYDPNAPAQPPAHVLRNVGAPTGTGVGPGGATIQMKTLKVAVNSLSADVTGLAGNPNDPDQATCKRLHDLIGTVTKAGARNENAAVRTAYRRLMPYLPGSPQVTLAELQRLRRPLQTFKAVVDAH